MCGGEGGLVCGGRVGKCAGEGGLGVGGGWVSVWGRGWVSVCGEGVSLFHSMFHECIHDDDAHVHCVQL